MRIVFLYILLILPLYCTSCAAWARDAARPGNRRAGAVFTHNERFVNAVIKLTNAERSKAGMLPLKRQDDLSKAARWLAEDMIAHNYFDHKDHMGCHSDSRLPKFGYVNYSILGENIAGGQTTPAQVVAAWMRSPGHRANLLNPDFREVGVACVQARNSVYRNYWVQDFGCRVEVLIYPRYFGSPPLLVNREQALLPNVLAACSERVYKK